MSSTLPAQNDLFDSPLTGSVKGETSLMEFPFFSLSKNGRTTNGLNFTDGAVTIQIRAANDAIATIYDKDILIYLASLMVEKINAGEVPEQTFTFTAHDYLRVTGRNRSKRDYERLASAIERLQGTQIKTNIEAGGEGITGFFSWIEKAQINYTKDQSGRRVMKSITLRVCDFIHRAILKDKSFLTYHPDYFSLAPLERRIYEIARKHCGRQEFFKISLERLHQKVGSENALRGFKAQLEDAIKRDVIPEYHIQILDDPRSPRGRALRAEGFGRKNRATPLKSLIVGIAPRIEPALLKNAN